MVGDTACWCASLHSVVFLEAEGVLTCSNGW